MYPILSVHSSTDEHLSYCHFLAVTVKNAMNIGVQIRVQVPIFSSFVIYIYSQK